MSPSWGRILSRHKGKTLADFCRRPKIEERIAGYAVAYSESFILMHRLNWDAFVLNGYSILREKDVKNYRFFTRATYWQAKGAKEFHLRPKLIIDIVLKDWSSAVLSISQQFQLICIHCEIASPDTCYIGIPLEVTKKTLILDNLDCNAEWDGAKRIKLDQITRIDFGGGYETALAATAPRRIRSGIFQGRLYQV